MKVFLHTLFVIVILPCNGNAQLFGNQDKKMIENNTKQISLLNTYSYYLDKGLTIAHEGLDCTHSLKNGELDLHSLYYSSLLQVNPNIKKYPAVQNTIDDYAKMKMLQNAINRNVLETGMLSNKEKQSLKKLVSKLMTAAGKDFDYLNNLLTDGKYQLTDDERIKRIDSLSKRVLAKYHSLSNIRKRINTIVTGRGHQKANTQKLRQLYGMP